MWGEAGSGKTHFLKALSTPTAIFFNHQNFPSNHLNAPIISKNTRILIDDVHLFSPEQQTLLFNLYNEWQARKLQEDAFTLVVTGEHPPLQMQIREDLRNRLGWGLVYQLQMLNDEDCKNALNQRASEKGIPLSPEVLQWIFTYCPRDIRLLFGLLESLDAYALRQQRQITIPLLKSLLQSNKDLFDDK